jgi:hypothetical protein
VLDSPDSLSTDDVDLVVVSLASGMRSKVSARLLDRGPRMRLETPFLNKQRPALSMEGPIRRVRATEREDENLSKVREAT